MVPTTTVRGRKRQHVVAIPATVARHLVVATGTRVYWAMPRTGQALLSVKPSAARGPERREIECPSCAAYRKEVEKLRAQLAQRPLRVHNEGVSQGYGMAQRHLGVVADRVGRIEQLVEDISARLPFARRTRSARGARARAVDVIPTPVLSPPAVPIDGGAATSGAEPPGGPLSAEPARTVTARRTRARSVPDR